MARRRIALLVAVALAGGLAVPVAFTLIARSEGVPYEQGDLFAAVGEGRIKHFNPSGALVDTLDARQSGEGGALVFDNAGRLYAANFTANQVSQFDRIGSLAGTLGGRFDSHPEAIARDYFGTLYVGLNDGSRSLLKVQDGNVVGAYTPEVENRGIDWADLDSDQCTLLYTSEGRRIKRFNVCTGEQLPDFAELPIGGDNRASPTTAAYAVRIRHNGEVMVATSGAVFRLDGVGQVVQTYELPGTVQLLTLNLDADLSSFWTGDHGTGRVSKVAVGSGATLSSLDAATEPGALLGGFAVFGEFMRAVPGIQLATTAETVGSQPAAVTAQLLNVPQPKGIAVTFTITGTNPQEGTAVTDESGTAVFRYVPESPGVDVVVARATSPRPLASLESSSVSLDVTPPPATALAYSGATSGTVGQPATLAARLTDASTNEPLPAATVSFAIKDGESCEALTDESGLAACVVTSRRPAGRYTVRAEFAGTPSAAPSAVEAPFRLAPTSQRMATALAYTGPASALQGEPATLSARLSESGTGRSLAGAAVSFLVDEAEACSDFTDATGAAACQVRISRAAGNHSVAVRFNGDGALEAASTSAQLLVAVPTGPVQGGRAVVLSVTSTVLGDRTIADTGEVATDGTTQATSAVASFPGPTLTGSVAEGGIATRPGAAEAHASIASLSIDIAPPVTSPLSITLGAVGARAQSSCGGASSGTMSIGSLRVGQLVLVGNDLTVAPNTVLAVPDLPLLPRIRITLNEQLPTTTRDGKRLLVTAAHIVVEGVADVVVSSATSDVHGCAPAARTVS